MVTVDLYPDGDAVPNDWDVSPAGNHYAAIDENKGSPSMTDQILASQALGDDNQYEQFDFQTITGIAPNSITQVVVWTYGYISGAGSPEVAISWNAGASFSAYVETGLTTGQGWHSNTWAGLSYSEADLATFQVSYCADCGTKLNANYIGACYIVVTYTPTPTGWGHKFIGVAGASIGKISGVAIANIGKVKGV